MVRHRLPLAVADQALSSGSNILFIVVAAHLASPSDFGKFSVIYGLYILCLGVARSVASEPMLLKPYSRRSSSHGAVLSTSLILGSLVGISIALAGQLAGAGVPSLIIGFGMPLLIVQDTYRMFAYGDGRIGVALALDAAWLTIQYSTTLAMFMFGVLTLETASLAWVVAAALSIIPALFYWRPSVEFTSARQWIRDNRRVISSLTIDFFSAQGVVQFAILIAAIVVDNTNAGALRLSQLVFGGIGIVVLGLRSYYTPAFANQPWSASRSTVRNLSIAFGFSTGLLGGIAYLVPVQVMIAVLGPTWAIVGTLVLVVGLERALSSSTQPHVWALRAQGQAGAVARSRVAVSILSIACAIPFGLHLGIAGISLALLTGSAIMLVRTVRLGRKLTDVLDRRQVEDAEAETSGKGTVT